MKVSLDWMKEYIEIGIPSDRLAEELTMLGLEVEEILYQGEKFRNFVVGDVREVTKHPSADKLVLCTVDTGEGTPTTIVCGAPNVAPGQHVAVALPGATVPHNQHDPEGRPFAVSRVKIRGELSNGMICSAHELGLGDDKDGIMVLDGTAPAGMPLSAYLGLEDTLFEIGVTPNRPDALSHIGIAREIGAILSTRAKLPLSALRESGRKAATAASVRVEDPAACPRYTARVMTGVRIRESSEWIKRRLNAVGIRPVNNVVDITNYVLMEIGQPLHAFDYDAISDHAIVVRQAAPGESLITLDGKSRTLRGSELLICDRRGPIALAGVMGGGNTEITPSTTNILIESAYFSPVSIRKTSKLHALTTDASQRFERGADPNITRWGVDRAASLIQHECGGEVLKGVIDVYPRKIAPRKVALRVDTVNKVLGTTLSGKEITSLLRRLWIAPAPSRSSAKTGGGRSTRAIHFVVPTHRPDLEREIDLVEEVARIYGYNKIETKMRSVVSYPAEPQARDIGELLRPWLGGSGYTEVVTNSMQERSVAALSTGNIVEIANPISKEMAALRTSLIPSLLGVVRNNIFHGTRDLRLFELGKSYFREHDGAEGGKRPKFREEDRLILCLSGSALPRGWDTKARQYDMSDLRGEVEALFAKIFLDKFKFIPYPNTNALTDIGLGIEINGRDAGSMGRVSADLLKRFEIEQEVFTAELSTEVMAASRSAERKYRPLPKYPPVMRDLALTVDEGEPIEKIISEIRSAGTALLAMVELFDIYTGEQVGNGKKSCAFALEFISEDHTLTQQEVDGIMKKIIDRVSSVLHAALRA